MTTPHRKAFPRSKFLLAACLLMAGAGATANGALLVYEGFSYGLSNGTTMNGVTANATGLTGNYSVLNTVSASGTASSTYSSTGLSFGSNFLTSTGGAIRLTASTSTNNSPSYSFAGVALNAGTVTGTIWNSFLVNLPTVTVTANASSVLRLNTSATGDSTNSQFISMPESSSAAAKPGVGYDNAITAYGGAASVLASTNYLVLTRLTNVGAALSVGSPGVATLFMFTQEAYDAWYLESGAESTLSTYATFTATDSVTSGNYAFDSSKFVQFTNVSGSGVAISTSQTAIFDELRYGTALADVVAVPEPASITLLIFSAIAAAFRFRKRVSIFGKQTPSPAAH